MAYAVDIINGAGNGGNNQTAGSGLGGLGGIAGGGGGSGGNGVGGNGGNGATLTADAQPGALSTGNAPGSIAPGTPDLSFSGGGGGSGQVSGPEDNGGNGASGTVSSALNSQNTGTINGGNGGNSTRGGGGGGAGALVLTGTQAIFSNSGSITGGTGGGSITTFASGGGGGGVGLTLLDGGSITNEGAINGGTGGSATLSFSGSGGAGVFLFNGGSFVNQQNGGVTGGFAGASAADRQSGGAAGVLSNRGEIQNSGNITGGSTDPNSTDGIGGSGIIANGGSIFNNSSALILGGAGLTLGGYGVSLVNDGGATLTNLGIISAGGGAGAAGVNVASNGNTVINGGTIVGSSGANAVTLSGNNNTLQLLSGYGFSGNVVASGSGNIFGLGGDADASFDLSRIGTTTQQFRGFASFQKTGDSRWTLTGTTAVPTSWTLYDGTLAVSNSANLAGTGSLNFEGGTLATTGNVDLMRPVVMRSAGGTLDVAPGATLSLRQVVVNAGLLTKTGAGTLVFYTSNTHTGATNIMAGTLLGGIQFAFAESSAMNVAGGATLGLNNFDQFANNLAGAGNVMLSGATLTANNTNNTTFSGTISDAGNLIKTGAATLTLAGNSTYTGSTSVNGGILSLGGDNALGQTSRLTTAANTTTHINGHNQTVGALTNAGSVTLGGGGALTSGLLTNGGTMNITGGTLSLSNGGTSTTIGGLTGVGTLNITGGELALSAANTGLGGQTNIAAGAAATLTGAGTLGASAISVLGDLNLNGAAAAFANALSGSGDINTNAAVTLTGNNSFSGAHHIGAGGALTVSQAANLGAAAATVNLDTASSSLVLNGVNGNLGNALTGVASSSMAVANGADLSLTGNNNSFLGQYNLSGNSRLAVATVANLGAGATVALAGAQDTLALNGYNGAFTNTVGGGGIVQVTGGANTTLTGSHGVAESVGVDITAAALNLDDVALFNHRLTGAGTLNIDTSGNAFNFGANTGAAFAGTVDIGNSAFALSGDNAGALGGATLITSAGAVVAVGAGNQAVGDVSINGATLDFAPGGVITTDTLAVTNNSIIRVDPALNTGGNLIDQDTSIAARLINSATTLTAPELALLTLQDRAGNSLGDDSVQDVVQGGNTVAQALYNFALSGSGGGLGVTSGLTQLTLLAGQNLTLTSAGAINPDHTLLARLTGAGNLTVGADNSELTLTNIANDYTGATTVNGGMLTLGADNALGQTSALTTAANTTVNINGHNQTVGGLNNAGTLLLGGGVLTSGTLTNGGTLNIDGGTLTSTELTNSGVLDITGGTLSLSNGGTSTTIGGLTGVGTLNITGGELALSAANTGLGGQTNIAAGASATLTGAGTLGASAISVLGDLNLNGAAAAFANALSGSGDINTNAAVTLTGNNSFSGAHHIGAGGALTVSQAANLGAAATVSLDTASSSLVLNGVNGSLANAVSGVASSSVNIISGSDMALTGNNSGFLGQYNLSGNSRLAVATVANLGAGATVALAGAQDTLALNGYNGAFTNTVGGGGIVQVTGGANTTLTGSHGVAESVGVDITAAALNLDDVALFNHRLTGAGTLNVAKNDANTAFNFGSAVGGAFSGTVNLQSAAFDLNDVNSTALTNAVLTLSNDSLTTVADGVQNIGALVFINGALAFNNIIDNAGVISSGGTIASNGIDTTGGGIVRVNLPENITPDLSGFSILQLDEGQSIVTLATGAATGTGNELTLTDENGEPLSDTVFQGISNTVGAPPSAIGAFNYGTTTGNDLNGLYVSYGLQALELQGRGNNALILTAALANNDTPTNDLSVPITGSGDLAIVSANDGSTVSLSDSTNNYTGATWVRSGNLRLDADKALGQTSLLAMNDTTTVDLDGTRQTVGSLATELGSTLQFGNGQLTVTNGGLANGALSGSGELFLTGGSLNVTQNNVEFSGSTDIASGAAARLTQAQGLGSGAINNNGNLMLDNIIGDFANPLSGASGNVHLINNAIIQLTGDNTGYSGLFSTNAGTVLTARNAQQLGNSRVANNGELILDTATEWDLINTISGNGVLVKRGGGTLHLVSDNVSTGLTRIDEGSLLLGAFAQPAASALMTVAAAPANTVLTPVTLTGNVVISEAGSLGGYGQVSGNVENHGTLIMPGASIEGGFSTLTIAGNYTGYNGTLLFNTVLEGDASTTDRLHITGDVTGQSYVTVNNRGGTGAETIRGIEIIDVGGSSSGQFILNGRVVGGAFEYFLLQGPGGAPNDGNWYLRTQGEDEDLRPEVESYTTNLAAANNMFVSSLSDRAGETLYTDVFTGELKSSSLWLRNQGSHNRSRDDSGELKTQDNRYVMQLGGDVAQWNSNSKDLLRVGVMAGYANSSNSTVAQTTGYRSTGSVEGYSVGLYATWFADNVDKSGAYIDAWALHSWFDNKVEGQDLPTQEYDSKGFTASVEGGYAFKVGEGASGSYFIQPKAQAIWMGVKADSFTEKNGTNVSGDGDGNIQSRLGVKAFITTPRNAANAHRPLFKPYVETNWVHNTKDFGTTLNGTTVRQAGASNIAELKVGLEAQTNSRLSLWGNIGQQVGNNGYSDTTARLGVKYIF